LCDDPRAPYGEAASAQVALDALRAQRGVGFSESTVDQFVQCIGLYPVGTLVELNSARWRWWSPRTASAGSSRG
jgi:HD-GYP domain-containing protein (c-di-GMP phosphodiesterase class II)